MPCEPDNQLNQEMTSGADLAGELSAECGMAISRSSVNVIRSQLRFKYDLLRHEQLVTEIHGPNTPRFAGKSC
jgi:hypothetical protein